MSRSAAVEISLCNPVRWRDGEVAEDHLSYGLYGALAQVGAVPPLTVGA